MSDIILVPQLGNVGTRPCYQTEQERYVDFMSKTVWTLPLGELSGVWISDVAPGDNSYIWFKIDPATGGMVYPTPFIYSTVYGQWIALNPKPAADLDRMLWTGTALQLWSYDGGDGTDPAISIPTPTTGAMWEVDVAFNDLLFGGVNPAGGGQLALGNTPANNDVITTAAPPAGGSVSIWGGYFAKRTARLFYTP